MDYCSECRGTGRHIEGHTNCVCGHCWGSGLEPPKPQTKKVRCIYCNGTGRHIEGHTNCVCGHCWGSGSRYVKVKKRKPCSLGYIVRSEYYEV